MNESADFLSRHFFYSGIFLNCVLVLGLWLGLVGCHHPGRICLDVRFYPQEPKHCGAAALESIFTYRRTSHDAADLKDYLYVPVLEGATPGLLVQAARAGGLEAEAGSGDMEAIQTELGEGRPLILLWKLRKSTEPGHFVVILGYNPGRNSYQIHDGERGPYWVKGEGLKQAWGLADRTFLRFWPQK